MSIKTRMEGSRDWIMNDPKSLVILMLMGTGMAFLFFATFSAALSFNQGWFLMVLFGVFSLLSLKQFIKIFKTVKQVGMKDALGGITANSFVWHKDKDGKKLYGGVEDGNDGYKGDEGSSGQDDEGNGEIGKEVCDIYK